MDGIGRRHSMLSPNRGIQVRSVHRVRNDFHERGLEDFSNLPSRRRRPHFVWPHQYLPNCKRTGAELILPLVHFRENMADTPGVARIVLQPIDEYHRVPVDSAHRGCSPSLAALLARTGEIVPLFADERLTSA